MGRRRAAKVRLLTVQEVTKRPVNSSRAVISDSEEGKELDRPGDEAGRSVGDGDVGGLALESGECKDVDHVAVQLRDSASRLAEGIARNAAPGQHEPIDGFTNVIEVIRRVEGIWSGELGLDSVTLGLVYDTWHEIEAVAQSRVLQSSRTSRQLPA
eukprot:765948-Hanusia_phi.AAC.1